MPRRRYVRLRQFGPRLCIYTGRNFHLSQQAMKIQGPRVAPKAVLYGITGYMKNFFGCEECRRNFLKMVSTVDSEVTTLSDSVLWLWRAHNKANKRLHGDISEDPKHLKIQFPPRNICPACHEESLDTQNSEWNIPNVLTYIVKMYREDKIVEDTLSNDTAGSVGSLKNNELDWWENKRRKKDLEKLRDLKDKKLNRKLRLKKSLDLTGRKIIQRNFSHIERRYQVKSSIFNQVDLGMCVAFYIFSTVILLFVYYHFTVKRKMKLCGLCAV